jgi:hypothetical protein
MSMANARLGTVRPRRAGERGAALVVILLSMLTLLGLGIATLWLTSGNLQVGGSVNQRTQALYVAEAGLERARAAMNAAAAPNLTALLTGASGTLDEVPSGMDAQGQPNGVGAVFMDGATRLWNVPFPPASFGRTSGTTDNPMAANMGTYSVWIRNDLTELRQGMYTNDINSTVVVRSRGVASDGRTNVVLEVAMIPTAVLGAASAPGAGGGGDECIAGKNSCDDNSSTEYGVTFGAATP